MIRRIREAGWRDIAIIAGAVVVGIVLGLLAWHQRQADRQIDGLSTALTAQCDQTKQLGASCVARPPEAVKASPDRPTVSPKPGPAGPAGANGLSIVGARIDSCRLILVREDGREYDAGPVCGKRGPTGSPGVSGSPGTDGRDGTDGKPGADGASITGVVCSDTHLIVTISTTGDFDLGAGSCGRGPAGTDGADGQPPYSWTYTGPLGKQYTCVRDDDFDPDKPTYHCQT